MNITVITPALPGSKSGNRTTAERWAYLLGKRGHTVNVVTKYDGYPCDLLIAMHAWRSHGAIGEFRKRYPDAPLIVALTGTDIYDHQYRFPEATRQSMAKADCLIGLHERVAYDIPAEFSHKLITVLQSADCPEHRKPDETGRFNVCVIGHLRDEKDSLRAAYAARLLKDEFGIRVVNAGRALNPKWERKALQEQASNPRFEWLGEIDKPEIQALMRRSQLMVISSIMEGGANVISEACRIGLPVLASDISGNVGLLGEAYNGYFRVGDVQDLARLLSKAESSEAFMSELTNDVIQLAHRFTPEAEQAALARALEKALAGS